MMFDVITHIEEENVKRPVVAVRRLMVVRLEQVVLRKEVSAHRVQSQSEEGTYFVR